jgi:hypothetical protein
MQDLRKHKISMMSKAKIVQKKANVFNIHQRVQLKITIYNPNLIQ